MTTRAIRTVLNALGYDLKRIPKSRIGPWFSVSDSRHKRRAPLKIEFLGPSGVGKTTLSEELVRSRRKSERWVLARELVSGHEHFNAVRIPNMDKHYEALLEFTLRSIAEKAITTADKYWLLTFSYKKLIIDLQLNRFSHHCPIVMEDGILHNFSPAIMSLAEHHDHDTLRPLLENRAVAYCYSSPELLVERIRKRALDGKSRPQHEGKSMGELREHSEYVQGRVATLFAVLRDFGLPCLELDMGNDITENAERVREFIKSTASTPMKPAADA